MSPTPLGSSPWGSRACEEMRCSAPGTAAELAGEPLLKRRYNHGGFPSLFPSPRLPRPGI